MIVPSIPATLPRFKVLAIGLYKYFIADPLPVAFELLILHNVGKKCKLLGAPALLIKLVLPERGNKLILEELLVLQWE